MSLTGNYSRILYNMFNSKTPYDFIITSKLHQFRENIFKLGYVVGSLGKVSIHPVTGDELLKVGRMYLGARRYAETAVVG